MDADKAAADCLVDVLWTDQSQSDLAHRAVAAKLREIRREALEEACAAVCKMCAEAKYPVDRCRGHWHHYWEYTDGEGEGGREIAGDCVAWEIRNVLSPKEPSNDR